MYLLSTAFSFPITSATPLFLALLLTLLARESLAQGLLLGIPKLKHLLGSPPQLRAWLMCRCRGNVKNSSTRLMGVFFLLYICRTFYAFTEKQSTEGHLYFSYGKTVDPLRLRQSLLYKVKQLTGRASTRPMLSSWTIVPLQNSTYVSNVRLTWDDSIA